MEQIIAVYVEEINSNPSTALTTIYNNINGGIYNEAPPNDPYIITVTSQYIIFVTGAEQPGDPATDNTIKVTVQSGDSRLTTILTKSRRSVDRLVRY
jgi:hypothetical protein